MTEVFKKYRQFVNGVTSEDSLQNEKFLERVIELNKTIPFSKMETAVSGIAGEAGEIADLWKKIKFHGKPWNDENRNKMIDECGDMFWYLSHLMESLDVEVEEVLNRNVDKLQDRYPGSKFTIDASENRHIKLHGQPVNAPNQRVLDNAVQEHLDRLGHTPKESPRAEKATTADVGFTPAPASVSVDGDLALAERSAKEETKKKKWYNIFG